MNEPKLSQIGAFFAGWYQSEITLEDPIVSVYAEPGHHARICVNEGSFALELVFENRDSLERFRQIIADLDLGEE